MKKLFAILLVCAMCILSVCAMAAAAYPTDKLAFRTGPNTRYAELFTLPQSTHIKPIEVEEGNGVLWVLCEFSYKGQTYQGYTGLKRMEITGNIYTASHALRSGVMLQACTVYAAPSSKAAVRGKVGRNEVVSYLRTEGDYDFVEFYDSNSKAPSRGWVDTRYVDVYENAACYMTDASNVYAEASSSSKKIGKVGKYEMVGYMGTVGSYDKIAFYSASSKGLAFGYVPTHIVDAYG